MITPEIPEGWFPIAKRLVNIPSGKYEDIQDAWLDKDYQVDESPLPLFDAYTLYRRGVLTLCNHRGYELLKGKRVAFRYLIGRFINKKPTHLSTIRYGK